MRLHYSIVELEEFIMASRTVPNAFFGWTWSAVLAGVFASLVVQILLTMLGFGIGLLAIDVPTAQSAPAGATWAAFVWWAVSGIIAAFIGGAIAAANSPDQTGLGRVGHALAAWSVAHGFANLTQGGNLDRTIGDRDPTEVFRSLASVLFGRR